MKTVDKIALRNLREHKAKTLIIGILISLGLFILVLGNSLLDTADKSKRVTFIENYTGHIMITKSGDKIPSLFGYMMNTGNETVQNVPFYPRVYDYVSSLDGVKAVNSQITGYAQIKLEDDFSAFSMLMGVEPESYRMMFPNNIEMIQGEFLSSDEPGYLISEKVYDDIVEKAGQTLKTGDILTIQGFSGGGLKIREVPLRGVYRFKKMEDDMAMVGLIDATTARELNGMVVGTTDVIQVEEENMDLLGDNLSLDDMFSFDLEEEELGEGGDVESGDDLYGILGDTSQREFLNRPDAGAWHFILVTLENENKLDQTILEMNQWFEAEGINVTASGWIAAAGPMGSLSNAFKIFFNVLVIILAVVSIIIIMNTLVVSIIERTREIGMMRAMGAQKAFVRRLFVSETMYISIIFGSIGIVLGAIVVLVLYFIGLPAPNDFFSTLFGGDVIHPVLSVGSVIQAFIISVVIGFISSLYPVSIALKIQPVKAIQTE